MRGPAFLLTDMLELCSKELLPSFSFSTGWPNWSSPKRRVDFGPLLIRALVFEEKAVSVCAILLRKNPGLPNEPLVRPTDEGRLS